MTFFDFLTSLEDDPDLHTARLLVLMKEFAGKNNTKRIEGITKLVKLDFLLRYPLYLERALRMKGIEKEDLRITDYESKSVESKMIRYRYGPWDPRYYRFINTLVGRGLCNIEARRRTVFIGLTEKGYETALKLSKKEEFATTADRARILAKHFDLGGTYLKDFIYETFPEIASLSLGEKIEYDDAH